MDSIILCQAVSLKKQGKYLLKTLDWEVKPGQHWAILGLNGAGKSSLLRMLTGEFWPSQGTITVLGHRFGKTDMTSLRQKIGLVSSFIAERIPSDMLAEQVVLTGKYKSSILYKAYDQAELDQACDMLTFLKASHLIGRHYKSLSQGEKQILLVARSLMEKPQLLILDEATSGLDLLARETFLSQIEQIAKLPQAPTILYVTHHAEEITASISHILLLKKGEIVAQGAKELVFQEKILRDFYEQAVQLIGIGQERLFIQPLLKDNEKEL
ncbi:iron complex transport system ATP-binding protein [Streptococcus rupicaprae]|uniref:Iron complex transport system ATP-binding protein n=1 Tax=Streptococcus rupicaprae TaxID=759619 RepID=A0ABV2FHC2_9STRE